MDYDAPGGLVVFDYPIDHDMELVGPMKLHVWIETQSAYDADIFVYVRKADAEGNALLATIPPGIPWQGAHGRLRASHRELDSQKSTPLCPVQSHERPLPVLLGEAIALDIAIWPMAMAWHAGQRLQVVVSGHDLSAMHPMDAVNLNSGIHHIRTGGKFDSHLLIPVTEG